MQNKLHVLHLARWYPSRADPMLGLFVKNQVTSLPQDVVSTVVFIKPVKGQEEVKRTVELSGKIREVRVTYPDHPFGAMNIWNFFRYMRREVAAIHGENHFDIIHVHILTRAGVVGRLLAEKFGVPMVVTESWSRYLQPAVGLRHWLSYKLARYATRGAEALVYVSKKLANALEQHGITAKRMVYIPNVVDTELFRPAQGERRSSGPVRLIHVSCFEEASKNISGLINAVAQLKSAGVEVSLCMVGEGQFSAEAESMAADLGIADLIDFKGLLPPAVVAKEVATSDFLIQTSRYETFGAVVPEAWACGTPVISTRVGVFAEMYRPELGEEISGTDPASIAAGIQAAADRRDTFSKEMMRKTAVDHFGKEVVGASLKSLYEDAIRSKNAGD